MVGRSGLHASCAQLAVGKPRNLTCVLPPARAGGKVLYDYFIFYGLLYGRMCRCALFAGPAAGEKAPPQAKRGAGCPRLHRVVETVRTVGKPRSWAQRTSGSGAPKRLLSEEAIAFKRLLPNISPKNALKPEPYRFYTHLLTPKVLRKHRSLLCGLCQPSS